MRFVGVVPARYQSIRLPGKALIEIAGKPLVQWVYERSCEASFLDEVWVATDDRRIQAAVERFGGKALMTSEEHRSGTDRVAEAASRIEADVYVNIQGDEPLISPSTVDAVCVPFTRDRDVQLTTASVLISRLEEAASPHVVKVVSDEQGRALYFSRAAIPHPRNPPASFFKHLGIYAYRRDLLLALGALRPSRLEKTEGLEQLRFLENGVPIRVVEVENDSLGVDTPEDVERVRPILQNRASGSPKRLAGVENLEEERR